MADASPRTSDLQQPHANRHSVHDEGSDDNDSADGSISQKSYTAQWQGSELSHQLEQRRATCRYFDNHSRMVQDEEVLRSDYFYQEHLKSCHFSPCKPIPAPHNDILPDKPPLRAEVPSCFTAHLLMPVKLRDKLLSPRHIRLVKLLPLSHSDGSDGSQRDLLRSQPSHLRFEVFQASLDDVSSAGQPIFAALSYVCGKSALTQHVHCGEDYVPTMLNLFEALFYVRHDDYPRLLWADGLCINQEDTKERNH
jgi:hypothetical protein